MTCHYCKEKIHLWGDKRESHGFEVKDGKDYPYHFKCKYKDKKCPLGYEECDGCGQCVKVWKI